MNKCGRTIHNHKNLAPPPHAAAANPFPSFLHPPKPKITDPCSSLLKIRIIANRWVYLICLCCFFVFGSVMWDTTCSRKCPLDRSAEITLWHPLSCALPVLWGLLPAPHPHDSLPGRRELGAAQDYLHKVWVLNWEAHKHCVAVFLHLLYSLTKGFSSFCVFWPFKLIFLGYYDPVSGCCFFEHFLGLGKNRTKTH